MRVARLHAPGDLRLHDEPEPIPALGEALLQITSVGICGSDLHWFAAGGIGEGELKNPLVLGHEFAALTDQGERVAVDPAIPCRRCEHCRAGHPNLCPRVIFSGDDTQDGALRQRMAWPRGCLYPLPDSLSDAEGAMLEPLGVALHAVDLGRVQPGMTVGVFGCGPIGLLIIQAAKLSGASRIIATDVLSHRVDMATKCGAHVAIMVNNGSELSENHGLLGGRGVDVAFEVAGEQAAVDMAIAAALPGGVVILVGIPADHRTSFLASQARRKGLTLKLVRRMKHTYPRAIELVSSGQVDVRSLVTHRYPLEEVGKAFEVARRREGLKVIVEP
jgi:L-iditol 2-dehydrogenase